MNAYEVIQLAEKHAANGSEMQTSAQMALADAKALQKLGKCTSARNRAVQSLQYSVGVFHPDYQATKVSK